MSKPKKSKLNLDGTEKIEMILVKDIVPNKEHREKWWEKTWVQLIFLVAALIGILAFLGIHLFLIKIRAC